jgi:hydrogenase maturation protease
MHPKEMNTISNKQSGVVVAGFGGPRGDDQAGWHVLALLAQRPHLAALLLKCDQQTSLVEELDGCCKLIVVDACRGGSHAGDITQLEWPDPRVRQYHNHSAHGVRLCNALQLAEQLGKLPPMVDVFGVDTGQIQTTDELSPDVRRAVPELERKILAKISEAVDAREIVC